MMSISAPVLSALSPGAIIFLLFLYAYPGLFLEISVTVVIISRSWTNTEDYQTNTPLVKSTLIAEIDLYRLYMYVTS